MQRYVALLAVRRVPGPNRSQADERRSAQIATSGIGVLADSRLDQSSPHQIGIGPLLGRV